MQTARNPATQPILAPSRRQLQEMPDPPDPRIYWLGGLLLIVFIGAGYWRAKEFFAQPIAVAPVRTAKAYTGTVEKTVRVSGTTASGKQAFLVAPKLRGTRSTRDSGELGLTLQKLAAPGSRLKRGDMVAEFDRQFMVVRIDDFRANVMQQESNLLRLRANLDLRRVQQDLKVKRAKSDMEKAELDLQTAPVRSAMQVARFRMNLDEASARYQQYLKEGPFVDVSEQAAIRRYEIEVEQAARELRSSENNMEDMVLRAPIDGVFVLRRVPRGADYGEIKEGDIVGSGQMFAQIVDTTNLTMDASLNQVDAEQVKNGLQARVYVDAFSDLELPAKIVSIGAVSRSNGQRPQFVREVPVRLQVEGTDPRLIPNLSASADIVIASEENTVIVPLECVFRDADEKPFAMVQKENGWERRDVEVGLANRVAVAVSSGLKDGEVVAAERR